MSDIVLIDVQDALKRMMNNGKLYAKLLVKFKDNTNLNELEDALASGDMETAKTAAHTLKGLAANLSLIELHKQSMEMDTQLKNKSVNPDQFGILKNTYSATMEEIEKVIARYE